MTGSRRFGAEGAVQARISPGIEPRDGEARRRETIGVRLTDKRFALRRDLRYVISRRQRSPSSFIDSIRRSLAIRARLSANRAIFDTGQGYLITVKTPPSRGGPHHDDQGPRRGIVR